MIEASKARLRKRKSSEGLPEAQESQNKEQKEKKQRKKSKKEITNNDKEVQQTSPSTEEDLDLTKTCPNEVCFER